MGPIYSGHELEALRLTVEKLQPSAILEIGPGAGYATRVLARAMADAQGFVNVTTLEKGEAAEQFRETFGGVIPAGIEYIEGAGELLFELARLRTAGRRFQVIFHANATMASFRASVPLIERPGLFLTSHRSSDWAAMESNARVSSSAHAFGDLGILSFDSERSDNRLDKANPLDLLSGR